jgi:4-diphosphocytidyl-2-C-methyl-D-erythritol kinase
MYSWCNQHSSLLKSLTLPAFAKINLGLRILRKRQDGFHDLETVFLRIGWKDELSFAPSSSIEMTASVSDLPTDEGNLCIRAARALAGLATHDEASKAGPFGVHIHLDKHIPHGAGLGGGSSDAATVLKACSAMWGLNDDLETISASLGSDVPFFMGSPVAYGTGRGEVLSGMSFPKALVSARILVVVPDQRVSTADAFSKVVPRSHHEIDLRDLVSSGSLSDWGESLQNDFEPSVFGRFPVIRELKESLLESGADYASMSGSGSAVFGIFATQEASSAALRTVLSTWPSYRYWEGRTDAAIHP